MWRAYQQDTEAVQQWLQKEFPKIKTLARKAKAEIYFADEAGVRSYYHSGTTWAKRGKTPIVSTTAARFGLNLVSAIKPRGQMRFMITKGRVGANVFIDFLIRLLHNAKRPIFLIVDGHSANRAKKVRQFVKSVKDRLRLFFLPQYAPELNPDEWVWNHLKHHGIGRHALSSKLEIKRVVISHMRRLQKPPHLACSFFRTEMTRYAA
jgi:transposase